jgi:gentisate 1,2-dioxygenase
MCWHGHINESDHRTYWFDAANMPLVCGLEASFFEPGRRDDARFWEVDEGDERLYRAAGLAPAVDPQPESHSPKYRYSGEETRRMLDALKPGADGAKWLRYVHPRTGGPVMPTLDCYAARLAQDAPTQPQRTTWNAIVLVVAGEGRSTVGDRTFEWSRHDVFTVPHWMWASHTATGAPADFFVVTDRSVYEALDLARLERR